jgi:hypothetical protein
VSVGFCKLLPDVVITPDRPDKFWFETYSRSVQRFRDIDFQGWCRRAGFQSHHLDGSKTKLPVMTQRKPGDPNPYVIGNETVKRYLTVATECAEVGLLRIKSSIQLR